MSVRVVRAWRLPEEEPVVRAPYDRAAGARPIYREAPAPAPAPPCPDETL